jgi:hypothetical protein
MIMVPRFDKAHQFGLNVGARLAVPRLFQGLGRKEIPGRNLNLRARQAVPLQSAPHTELHSNVALVAAGFSLRCTGETPVPPRKIGRKIFDWPQLGITIM